MYHQFMICFLRIKVNTFLVYCIMFLPKQKVHFIIYTLFIVAMVSVGTLFYFKTEQPSQEDVKGAKVTITEKICLDKVEKRRDKSYYTSTTPVLTVLAALFPVLPLAFESFSFARLSPSSEAGPQQSFLTRFILLSNVPLASEKENILLAHIAGQTSGFSFGELAKYMMSEPDKQFWNQCNTTSVRCLSMLVKSKLKTLPFPETQETPQALPLLALNETHDLIKVYSKRSVPVTSLCPNTTAETHKQAFKHLHSRPDQPLLLIGASIVSFLSMHKLTYGTAGPERQVWSLMFVVYFVVGIATVFFYQFAFDSRNRFMDLILSFLFGAFFQYCILLCYRKHNISHLVSKVKPPSSTAQPKDQQQNETLHLVPMIKP